jgi:hypothetical protein
MSRGFAASSRVAGSHGTALVPWARSWPQHHEPTAPIRFIGAVATSYLLRVMAGGEMVTVHRISCELLLWVASALLVPCAASAQQADFTGKYILAGATGDLRFDPHSKDQPSLEVVQSATQLTATRSSKDSTEILRLPLNGDGGTDEINASIVLLKPPFGGNKPSTYTKPTRTAGTAKMLSFKGNQLKLEIVLWPEHPPNIPGARIHDVQSWKFVNGGQVLKICGSSDMELLGGFVRDKKSGCQIFNRQ